MFITIIQGLEKDDYPNLYTNPSYSTCSLVQLKIPMYEVEPCLEKTFTSLVKDDTLRSYYVRNLTGYSISVSNKDNFCFLSIRPIYMNKLDSADYSGVFHFKNRLFVCWGDLPKELFHRVDSVYIVLPSLSKHEPDPRSFYIGGDVPAVKELVECASVKVYIEITNCCLNKKKRKR